MTTYAYSTPAVVVGLCAHGLGIARDLDRAGVRVIALEANRDIPGVRTRHAEILFVSDINCIGLVDALLQLARIRQFPVKPVLYLTNDRMVDVVGKNVGAISSHFQLSWSHSTNELLPLLSKANIEKRCLETGMNYPRSQLLEEFPESVASVTPGFPIIVKPSRPLSVFKTMIADSFEALTAGRKLVEQSMPVLLQEYVSGDDSQIYFGAMFLDGGRILARFEGRKLHSRPMGHTTIAIPVPHDEVHEMADRFFAGLKMSGPVSVEFKMGPDGTFWVIAPTVGRTDFWEGLCSANGVPLGLIEYLSAMAQPMTTTKQRATHLWVNGERFPAALVWMLWHSPKLFLHYRVRGVYFDLVDLGPFLFMFQRTVRDLPIRVLRKLNKLFA